MQVRISAKRAEDKSINLGTRDKRKVVSGTAYLLLNLTNHLRTEGVLAKERVVEETRIEGRSVGELRRHGKKRTPK